MRYLDEKTVCICRNMGCIVSLKGAAVSGCRIRSSLSQRDSTNANLSHGSVLEAAAGSDPNHGEEHEKKFHLKKPDSKSFHRLKTVRRVTRKHKLALWLILPLEITLIFHREITLLEINLSQ